MSQRAGDPFVTGALGELMLGVDGGGNYAPVSAGALAVGTVVFGQRQVAVAGTALALQDEPATLRSGVVIRALPTNSGHVYVGGIGVTLGTGYPLDSGESIFLPVNDPTLVHVNAPAAGDGVAFVGY